jgi:hypothetical protein
MGGLRNVPIYLSLDASDRIRCWLLPPIWGIVVVSTAVGPASG